MAEATHKTLDRERKSQAAPTAQAHAAEDAALAHGDEQAPAVAGGDPAAAEARHAAVLRDPRLREAGALQRIRLVQQIQRGYGNGHVERVMARLGQPAQPLHDPLQRREGPVEAPTEDRSPTEAEKAAALKAAAAAEQAAANASARGADQAGMAKAEKATEAAAGQAAKQRASSASSAAKSAAQAGRNAARGRRLAGGRPRRARRMGEETGAATAPATSAAAEKAPSSPAEDPAFQAVVGKVRGVAAKQRAHPSAQSKAGAAQAAAESPASELSGKAQGRQVGNMQQAPAPSFDAAGFKAKLMQKIASLAPKTAEEADDFKESNKLGGVKDQMRGDVAQEQAKSQGPMEREAAAEPSTSGIAPKPVTPLQPNEPGAPPAGVGAAAAAPKPKTRAEVEAPLQAGSKQLDQQMAEADVTEQQLKTSNEPEFQAAVDAKGDAQAHAQAAPQEYRQAEQAQLNAAQAEASGAAQAQTQAMHADRAALLQQVGGQQVQAKTKDEQERERVGADIQNIYNETKANVETKLGALDVKVNQAFDQGTSAAKKTFEDYVESRMKAYKERRYGGWFGWARWAKDKFAGMPAEVNAFYGEGRALYLREMEAVIDRVAATAASTLNEAKAEVARGRQRIQEYVAKLPANLKKVGQEAAGEIQGQFDALEESVNSKQDELADSLAKKYQESLQAVDARIEELKAANRGLVDKAIGAIKGVIETIKKLKNMLSSVLTKASSVIGAIVAAPSGFFGNLLSAIKMGFNQFTDNIGEHMKQGLVGWLFGQLAEGGIKLPERFDLKGVLDLILQLLGLTYANIRARAVKLVGERTVAAIEKGVEIFKILVSEGPAGLWKLIQDKLASMKEQVMEEVKDFLITRIIKAGITWLLSLFNPVAAFIKACMAIYDIVMFFVENAQRIAGLINSILDSVSAVVAGSLGAAANLIEQSLAKAIPLAIGFLASLLHLGGIGQKVREVFDKIRKPVGALVDKLVMGAVKGFKKLGVTKLLAKAKAGVAVAKAKVRQAVTYVKAKARQGQEWAKKKVAALGAKVKSKVKGKWSSFKENRRRRQGEKSAKDKVKADALHDLKSAASGLTTLEKFSGLRKQILAQYRSKGLKTLTAKVSGGSSPRIGLKATASPAASTTITWNQVFATAKAEGLEEVIQSIEVMEEKFRGTTKDTPPDERQAVWAVLSVNGRPIGQMRRNDPASGMHAEEVILANDWELAIETAKQATTSKAESASIVLSVSAFPCKRCSAMLTARLAATKASLAGTPYMGRIQFSIAAKGAYEKTERIKSVETAADLQVEKERLLQELKQSKRKLASFTKRASKAGIPLEAFVTLQAQKDQLKKKISRPGMDKEGRPLPTATTVPDLRRLMEAGWDLQVLIMDEISQSGKELDQALKRLRDTFQKQNAS